ncbi:MAG TPA: nucleotidyltransferase domain-containing protein [Thermoleophilia bacterium]|nr:nucleotidyltransferase domain-containing protein [Thermoleophilia bacterium]
MLASLLGSETRARVLALLLAQPPRTYHVRELIRLTGGGASGVQREVGRLEALGLVVSERTAGGRRTLRVVAEHELLEPLRALLEAGAGAPAAAGARGRAGAGSTADSGLAGAAAPATAAALAEAAERIDPRLRSRLGSIRAALLDAGVERAVVFGSATDLDTDAPPRDLDVLVRLSGPLEGRAARYFALRAELERASGLPVDLVEEEAVTNPYLRDEIEHTGVVILEAA